MDFDYNKIISWLDGKLSPEEASAVERSVTSSEEFRARVDETRALLGRMDQYRDQKKYNTRRNWHRLDSRIRRAERRKRIFDICRNTAAVIVLPLICFVAFELIYRGGDRVEEAIIEQESASGLVSKITLPDGSTVWLNSRSKLTYPAVFSSKGRNVKLDGEAYFAVAADRKNMFSVELPGGTRVGAYGTEFNINTCHTDSEVILVSGNVEITLDDKLPPLEMGAGDMAVISGEAGVVNVTAANVYVKTAWKDGKIVFRRDSMEKVAERLSQHFNVDIELAGSEIYDYTYTATFTTETIQEILSLLSMSAPIKWEEHSPVQQGNMTYPKRKFTISRR